MGFWSRWVGPSEGVCYKWVGDLWLVRSIFLSHVQTISDVSVVRTVRYSLDAGGRELCLVGCSA